MLRGQSSSKSSVATVFRGSWKATTDTIEVGRGDEQTLILHCGKLSLRRTYHPERLPNQIHQHHAPIALRPHRPATCHTQRAGLAGPDHHLKRCILARVVDPYQLVQLFRTDATL